MITGRYCLFIALLWTSLQASDHEEPTPSTHNNDKKLAHSAIAQLNELLSRDPAMLVWSYVGTGRTEINLRKILKDQNITRTNPIIAFGVYRIAMSEDIISFNTRFLMHKKGTYATYLAKGSFQYNTQDDTVTSPTTFRRDMTYENNSLNATLQPMIICSPESTIRTSIWPTLNRPCTPRRHTSFVVERFPEALIADTLRELTQKREAKKRRLE